MEIEEQRAQNRATPQMQNEPQPRFPEQHQPAPGRESDLQPRPRYEARRYRAAGKLEGKVALITGGDSGIGRAVAVLCARGGKSTPLGRPAQPGELALAYVFLASDADSSYITGIVLQVTGGEITA